MIVTFIDIGFIITGYGDLMANILITGGAGYVGSCLVPKLLELGHSVTILDILYFGKDHLEQHDNLKIVKGDIRDIQLLNDILPGHDTVLHLACISNDPSFELDPDLSKAINYDAFEPLVQISKESKVKKFIYASTSSVYGISDAQNITETHPLKPITDYNKYKGLCEPILNKFKDDSFHTITIRPATVCGYSSRMRLDLTVNILTNHAFHNGKILVFGGSQLRPHIHIEDITDLYVSLIERDLSQVNGEIFNAGYDNQSVMNVAQTIAEYFEEKTNKKINLEVTPSDDIRSYHICSDKIKDVLGFAPKRSIKDAVSELFDVFDQGKLPNSFEDPKYFNIKQMKEILDA